MNLVNQSKNSLTEKTVVFSKSKGTSAMNFEKILSVTRGYFDVKPKTPKMGFEQTVRVKPQSILAQSKSPSLNWTSFTKPPGIRTTNRATNGERIQQN